MTGHKTPQSHQTHRTPPTRHLNTSEHKSYHSEIKTPLKRKIKHFKVESEYFCRVCKKWYPESEYDIEKYMCKKCAAKQNNNF